MQVTDPVCGMMIDSGKAAASETHQGQTFYFCSGHCQKTFKGDPGKYAAKAGAAGAGHGAHQHHG